MRVRPRLAKVLTPHGQLFGDERAGEGEKGGSDRNARAQGQKLLASGGVRGPVSQQPRAVEELTKVVGRCDVFRIILYSM